MFRKFITALIFAASPAVAQNQVIMAGNIDHMSQPIAEHGLVSVEATLASKANPEASDRFVLGAVRFLRGVEISLQLRYRHDATLHDIGLPVLRLPVPQNPAPEPFYPALITDLFKQIGSDMESARAALSDLDETTKFKVAIDLRDLWFDINENGTRDMGESFYDVGLDAMDVRPGSVPQNEVFENHIIHFDTADAAWLRAYTHVLSALSDLVLAFDPTDPITKVAEANAKMDAIRGAALHDRFSFLLGEENSIDLFAMIYGAINQVPDAGHTSAARAHLLAVVQENRAFWQQVVLETDDDNEWLPNDAQTSAFGVSLPEGTGDVWLAVLADGEAVLNGELLVPHWKVEPGGGVNVMKLMENPVEVDALTWFQGHGLLSVMESGPLITGQRLRLFDNMFGGNSGLFAFWLN